MKNKVEEQDILDEIAKVEYHILPDTTTTICVLHLNNGWTSTGISACVDPANFNKETGEDWAYKDAFKKLWPLFGFLLRQHLHLHGTTFISRLKYERDDHLDRLKRLGEFLSSPKSDSVPAEALSDLKLQHDLMTQLGLLYCKRYDGVTA